MTKIPMLIVDEFEIRKRKLIFDKCREFIKNRLCPMAYKDNELIDVPSHATSWHLRVVVVQMRIIDKGKPLISSFLNHLRRYLFLTNTKKGFVFRVIPEDANARHLFIESLHVGHLLLMFFVCKLSHNSVI